MTNTREGHTKGYFSFWGAKALGILYTTQLPVSFADNNKKEREWSGFETGEINTSTSDPSGVFHNGLYALK